MFFLLLISPCHKGEVLDSLSAKPKTASPLFSFYRCWGGRKKRKRKNQEIEKKNDLENLWLLTIWSLLSIKPVESNQQHSMSSAHGLGHNMGHAAFPAQCPHNENTVMESFTLFFCDSFLYCSRFCSFSINLDETSNTELSCHRPL